MVRIIASGACGRMCKRVLSLSQGDGDIDIAGGVECEGHPDLGRDIGQLIGVGDLGVKLADNIEDVIDLGDVVVEFSSSPQVALEHLDAAVKHGKAMVIGTTGYSSDEMDKLKSLASQIPCVQTPNMSVGVNVLFKIVGEVASILGRGYDIEITEVHHRFKKDAPSGTAAKLAQIIADSLERDLEKVGVYGRKGIVGQRTDAEIGVHALRGGDIVGDHTVMFATTGERVEIKHQAQSRDAFAQGAIRAIKFIADKPKGLYDMADVLGIK